MITLLYYEDVILRISSTENGNFLFLTSAVIRVIPGWYQVLCNSNNDDKLINEQYTLVNVSDGILALPGREMLSNEKYDNSVLQRCILTFFILPLFVLSSIKLTGF